MSFYPPQGSQRSHRSNIIYPATPIPGAFPAPQLQVPQPPMMIVPSRANSRHSLGHHSHRSHRSRHDDEYEYDRHHDRDRDHYHDDRDRADHYYDRDRDYHDRDRDRDRHHKRRSHSRQRSHHQSDRDRRHRDKDDRKHHRSHRRHHTAPQVMVPPQMGLYPGQSSVGYPGSGYPGSYYDYRPSFGQRLRQFFGFAPVSPHYQYKSDKHSWGFLGRSKRPRYVDARTGIEVDKYGRTVQRI